jgi:hypothetical protein
MPRIAGGVIADGHNRIHSPGVYEHVLRRVCEQATHESGAVLSCPNSEQLAVLQRAHAKRTAAMMEQRRGEPLAVQSWQLPDGLPGALFARWPRRGRARGFWVTPDDFVTVRP